MDEPNVQEPTSQPWEGPKTQDEAKCFHNGYLAGLTAYARACGHSTLRRENESLAALMEAQGWKTIEAYERLAVRDRAKKAPYGGGPPTNPPKGPHPTEFA